MSIIPQDKASIVLVSESLRPGGNTVYAGLLLRGLLGVGLSPRLASPDAPPAGYFGKEEQASVEVFPGMQGGFFRPFAYRRLISWAQARNPSVLHGLSAFAAPVCQKLAQALNLSYVLSIQHYQSKGGLRVDGRCKAVIACSEAIRENLVNDAHVPKELVRVVTIGIELPARPAQAPVPEAEGERLPLVAMFAKLTPRKDVATYVCAARQVLDVLGGACQFLIVGEGPEEPALRKLVRELQLEKHITFAHPSVPHGQILGDADLYVQTSKEEGFGVSTLEAMAWGLPVVATSVGGLITLVRDGQTGFLVPVGNPNAVAGKILDLLSDRALRQKMGQAARALVADQYSAQQMIDDTEHLYAEVLGLVAAPSGIYRFRSASGQYRAIGSEKNP